MSETGSSQQRYDAARKKRKAQLRGNGSAVEPPEVGDKLAEMNAQYCVVLDGARTRVLFFERYSRPLGHGYHVRHIPTFLAFNDFKNLHLNKNIMVVGESGAQKPVPLGHWWIKHPERQQYRGVNFEPGRGAVVEGRLNLWRGWGIEPKKGDWSLMQKHIWEVTANNNENNAIYQLDWLAWSIQHPDEPAETAIVFRGKRGSGKGTLGNAMVRIFGQHGVHISSIDHLTGRFNAHLRDACLLFADEAYWPGNRGAEGNLKRLTTEPDLFIEPKGRDGMTTRNMLHIIMASNEDWVVPAGEHERRFAVFDVSDQQLQNEKYFTPLYEQLENGGYAAMLFDLLNRDLRGFHPRQLPKSGLGLLGQQRQNLYPLDAWWVELLETGQLEGADPIYPHRAVSNGYEDEIVELARYGETHIRRIRRRGLYDQARSIEPRLRNCSDHLLGHYLSERGCVAAKVLRRRGWHFPPLDECRRKWEERFPGWPWRDRGVAAWEPEDGALSIGRPQQDDESIPY
jgi:hypothetical protein